MALLQHVGFQVLQHHHQLLKTVAIGRSDKWHAVEKHFLSLPGNDKCSACAGTTKLQVHHKMPFHKDPADELDLNNLITLCMGSEDCHIRCGHGDSFQYYNPDVVADAFKALAMTPANRIAFFDTLKSKRLKL